MAWRSLTKNKVSSLINIGGLAVGLTTAVLIILVIANEFSYDKFQANLPDIYQMMKNQKQMDGVSTGSSTPGPLVASLRNDVPETNMRPAPAVTKNCCELVTKVSLVQACMLIRISFA